MTDQTGKVSPTPATTHIYPAVGTDMLFGADAIAEFLFGAKQFRRRVYNLIDKRALPVFRMGASVCARKSVLLAYIHEQEKR